MRSISSDLASEGTDKKAIELLVESIDVKKWYE